MSTALSFKSLWIGLQTIMMRQYYNYSKKYAYLCNQSCFTAQGAASCWNMCGFDSLFLVLKCSVKSVTPKTVVSNP